MKIILLKDVKRVGKRFEEKEVADGFALNMLIPKKMAVPATGAAAGNIKNLKEGLDQHKEAGLKKLESEVAKLAGGITTVEKANEKNHLFAALTSEKISGILLKQGISIGAECIRLERPIKETGTFEVPIKVGEKEAKFRLEVRTA